MDWQLHQGDSLDILPALADGSVDSIITDPPYELGFLGNSWDRSGIANSVELWRQCLRVLKPGGYLVSFGGSRTYHNMAAAIQEAGFEIRDQLIWLYGSGFVKNELLTLKPAHEPACLARKPFRGSAKENIVKWGTGALNTHACRTGEMPGRFPANVMHDGSETILEIFPETDESGGGRKGEKGKRNYLNRGKSTFLSGIRSSSTEKFWDEQRQDFYTLSPFLVKDSGSAARYFYCAKASPEERKSGNNTHPTVKPLELMRWLVRLVTPVGGTVLDPFTGSGSTGCAALMEGFKFIGNELNPEYFKIAQSRMTSTASKGYEAELFI